VPCKLHKKKIIFPEIFHVVMWTYFLKRIRLIKGNCYLNQKFLSRQHHDARHLLISPPPLYFKPPLLYFIKCQIQRSKTICEEVVILQNNLVQKKNNYKINYIHIAAKCRKSASNFLVAFTNNV